MLSTSGPVLHACLGNVHAGICDFTMDLKLEESANIKFCVQVGKSAMKPLEMFQQAYNDGVVGDPHNVSDFLDDDLTSVTHKAHYSGHFRGLCS